MNKYIDIKVKGSKYIKSNKVINDIVTEIHRYLNRNKINTIGLSYPNMFPDLGDTIRIHGTEAELESMYDEDLWGEFNVKVSRIKDVPDEIKHRTISRVQTSMSNSKLNRLIKRGTIPNEDIKKYKIKMVSSGLDNPYLQLKSESNKRYYMRFMNMSECVEETVEGVFDEFGMSKKATIPWF